MATLRRPCKSPDCVPDWDVLRSNTCFGARRRLLDFRATGRLAFFAADFFAADFFVIGFFAVGFAFAVFFFAARLGLVVFFAFFLVAMVAV